MIERLGLRGWRLQRERAEAATRRHVGGDVELRRLHGRGDGAVWEVSRGDGTALEIRGLEDLYIMVAMSLSVLSPGGDTQLGCDSS